MKARVKLLQGVSVFLFFCAFFSTAALAQGEEGYTREAIDLETQDGLDLLAIKYSNGAENPEWGGVIMHPAGDNRLDWRLPYFARAGMVGIGMAGRHHEDVEHAFYESLMLDVATAVEYLREVEKVEKVFLLGHSGGGSLMTLYAHQSAKRPGDRFRSPVAGQPVDWELLGFNRMPHPQSVLRPKPDLNHYKLPRVDLLIVSAAHYGAGWALVRKIDPSVTDEQDPTSLDPALDMYNPANGFEEPPESSNYSKDLTFLGRYKEAQEQRAWRLVRQARSYIEEKEFYAKLMQTPGFKELQLYEQMKITRKAITQRYLLIPRLLAIPNFTDLSIDPNDRVVGSNRTLRPDQGNYSEYFHPSFITPESLVSTEGPSSPVHLLRQIKEVTIPTLFICGTADMQEFPSEREAMFKASGATIKELVWIEGADHGYRPRGPKAGDGKQRDRAAQAMVDFIQKKYPRVVSMP
jgi:pimeloyl-ACP methyl ester carboxylesterase